MNSKPLLFDSHGLFFPNAKQFRETGMSQVFSLPMPIMKYIWSNPSSPGIYKKLITSCKLFFLKNPILVLNNLVYDSDNGWGCCKEDECHGMPFGIGPCEYEHKKIDMDKLEDKLWITNRFAVITSQQSNFVSDFIPKIYQYTVKALKLSGQILSYDDLLILSSGVKDFYLELTSVSYSDGEQVSLENIIKLFSGGRSVRLNFSLEPGTAALCKCYEAFIDACNTVAEVKLSCNVDVFDVPTFFEHLKRSKNRSLIQIFSFDNKHRLIEVINKILQMKFFEFVPPVIRYLADRPVDVKKMKGIQASVAAKYR